MKNLLPARQALQHMAAAGGRILERPQLRFGRVCRDLMLVALGLGIGLAGDFDLARITGLGQLPVQFKRQLLPPALRWMAKALRLATKLLGYFGNELRYFRF